MPARWLLQEPLVLVPWLVNWLLRADFHGRWKPRDLPHKLRIVAASMRLTAHLRTDAISPEMTLPEVSPCSPVERPPGERKPRAGAGAISIQCGRHLACAAAATRRRARGDGVERPAGRKT